MVTETWLNSDFPENRFNHTYDVFRYDRQGRGGGVMLLVWKELKAKIIEELKPYFCEALWVDIVCGTEKLRIGVIYRPPPRSTRPAASGRYMLETPEDTLNYDKAYYEYMVWNILGATNCPHPFLLLGDFNFPLINWSELKAPNHGNHSKFLDLVLNAGFSQLITKATHTNGNILDLALTNELFLVSDVSVLEPFSTSDHYAINLKVRFAQPATGPAEIRRDYWNANFDEFSGFLMSVDWANVFMSCATIDQFWMAFTEVLNAGIEKFVPLKSIYKGKKKCPRQSIFISNLKTKKRKSYLAHKKSKNPVNLRRSKQASQNVRKAMRDFVGNQERSILASKNPSKFFRFVNPSPVCSSYKSRQWLRV